MALTGVILAGGQSRRMGREKALLRVGAATLLQRVARAAGAVLDDVVVIGRPRPSDWPLDGVRFLLDDEEGQGPLGGLATALRSTSAAILALACDLPALEPGGVLWLVEESRATRAEHGLVALNGERLEPLFAVYRPTVLPLVERRLAEGRRSLVGLIEAGDFELKPVPADLVGQLLNINRPEDLEAFRRR